MKSIEHYLINQDSTIREAIKKMDFGGIGFIAIVDNFQKIVGVMTDGDFRRAVLEGLSLEDHVSLIMNRNFFSLNKNYSKSE